MPVRLVNRDHHLSPKHHVYDSAFQGMSPWKSLFSLCSHLAFLTMFLYPWSALTWSPLRISVVVVLGNRKSAEQWVLRHHQILLLHLCMCIGRGPSALPTLPADAPGGRSALAWEHDAPVRPEAHRSPASPPGTVSSEPGPDVPIPPQ